MRHGIEFTLDRRWLWITARILLAVVFLSSGLAKLIDFQGGLNEMRAAGLHPEWFFNIATALILVSSAVLIILDKALWLGAVALICFLLLTILFVHRFWEMQEPYATQALYWAMEHVSLAGGLVSTAIASDIAIQAEEIIKARERIAHVIAHESGQPVKRVLEDIERDLWMLARREELPAACNP